MARRKLLLAVLVLTGVLAPRAAGADPVAIKVVKYPGLAETVRQLRGKVVVVDLWALW